MMTPPQAFKLNVYNKKFYEILQDNLSEKVVKYNNTVVDFGKSKMCDIARSDWNRSFYLSGPDYITVSEDSHHVCTFILKLTLKTKVLGLELVRHPNISNMVRMVIWLMEDNLVFIGVTKDGGTYANGEIGNFENYKILELSKFIKLLKNPLELI